MTSRRSVLRAYLLTACLLVSILALAWPATSGYAVGARAAALGIPGASPEPSAELSVNTSDVVCLVEKHDVVMEDISMEVRHQKAVPLQNSNTTIQLSMPGDDADRPLIFSQERVEADKLCATLSFEHAPVHVILTNADLKGLEIDGRSMHLDFDRGSSEKIELWITLESAIELLPELSSISSTAEARDILDRTSPGRDHNYSDGPPGEANDSSDGGSDHGDSGDGGTDGDSGDGSDGDSGDGSDGDSGDGADEGDSRGDGPEGDGSGEGTDSAGPGGDDGRRGDAGNGGDAEGESESHRGRLAGTATGGAVG